MARKPARQALAKAATIPQGQPAPEDITIIIGRPGKPRRKIILQAPGHEVLVDHIDYDLAGDFADTIRGILAKNLHLMAERNQKGSHTLNETVVEDESQATQSEQPIVKIASDAPNSSYNAALLLGPFLRLEFHIHGVGGFADAVRNEGTAYEIVKTLQRMAGAALNEQAARNKRHEKDDYYAVIHNGLKQGLQRP